MAPFIIKGSGQFLEENVAVWHERGYNVHSDTHLQETENTYTWHHYGNFKWLKTTGYIVNAQPIIRNFHFIRRVKYLSIYAKLSFPLHKIMNVWYNSLSVFAIPSP